MVRPVSIALSLALAASLSGCGALIATIDHPLAISAHVAAGPLQSFQNFPPVNMSVYPAGFMLRQGDREALSIRLNDDQGQLVTAPIALTSLSSDVIAVSPDQSLVGVAPGTTSVVVSAGGTALVLPVTVLAPAAAPGGDAFVITGPTELRIDRFGPVPTPLSVSTSRSVSWQTSDPKVVTVDAQGRLTAVGNGSANVTAAIGSYTSPPLTVDIKDRPYYWHVTDTTGARQTQLAPHGSDTLKSSVTDANNTPMPQAAYAIDVPALASVDPQGHASALSAGQTQIRPVAAQVAAPDRDAFLLAIGQAPQSPALGAGSLAVSPAAFSLPVGSRQALQVQTRDASGSVIQPTVSYAASPDGLVTVDAHGVVTALKPGSVNLAVSGNGVSASVPIQVVAASNAVAGVGASAITLDSLGTFPAPLAPGAQGVSFTSANPQVVAVGADGTLSAIADGQTTLSATAGGQTSQVAVTIHQQPAYLAVHTAFPGDPREVIAQQNGLGVAVSATAFDFNGNAMPIDHLTSDNLRTASPSQGFISVLGPGSATIRAVCKGVSSNDANSIRLVSMADSDGSGTGISAPQVGSGPGAPPPPPPVVFSAGVSPAALGVTVGASVPLTVTVKNGAGQVVATPLPTYSTDNPAVATVDTAGKVTGVSVGTANVTVSVPGSTVQVPVTVSLPVVPSLVVNPTSLSLNALGLSPTQLVATSNVGAPTWASDNTGVATVDASGHVTAVGNGSANITASAGGVQVTVPVTIAQRASFVRLSSALTGDPREIVFNNLGTVVPLSASVTDSNGNAMPVLQWIVDNPAVISVDASGHVTVLGNGSSYVRVVTAGNVTSSDGQSILFFVDANNAASVDTTIDLP